MSNISMRCADGLRDRTRTRSLSLSVLCVASCLTALPALAGADTSETGKDDWATLRLLEGTWHGEVSGRLGQGTGVRHYDFLFDDRYLVARHSSVRLPQEQSPEGDHHRELTIFSYDHTRETTVLREFNVEGYVLRYRCAVEPKRVVCDSESIENGDGMRARLTIDIRDRYRFDETFQLGSSGDEPSYYLTVHWTRTPDIGD